MKPFAIDVLLAIAVASVWLGCAGFARLRSPFDRQHTAAFVNATAGLALVVAAFLADGASARALKILLVVVASLVTGSATSHAVGRALRHRTPPEARPGART